jgi:tetratricopeptide (TPR) repeat protein
MDPERPTRVFIAYDFEIGGTLPFNLARVSARAPEGHIVDWPGDPDGATQGAIWKTIVQSGIGRCDRLLAFVDLPNANVGFEVGYGLGLGKAVALARVQPTLPAWLGQPPFHGFLCPLLETPDEIRDEVRSPLKDWIQLPIAPQRGTGTLVLCPSKSGAAFLEMLPDDWGWRILPKSGWDLHGIPELLSGIGTVIWVIAPHHEGPAGRDGRENAALSVIAGYAEARPEIELRVLQAKNARVVVDVVAGRAEFSTPEEFADCLEAIKAEWEAKHAPPPASRPALPERRHVEPLPRDDWSEIPERFIGRELQLNDVADAVQGLLHRARTGREPDGGRAVKVVWVHGFGGMGKSWFLHRSRLNAGADVRALVVDWDSTIWRHPLTGEPRCPADLFETIAYRLAQACGAEAADPYWSAKERVREQGALHQRLGENFEAQLALASGPERVGSALVRLLQNEGVWVDELEKRARKLETWRRDPERYRSLFVAWCHETARDADLAAIEPDRVLAEGLRESLRLASRGKPLVLLLDTCEVLSADLDRWLRRLLVPLCRDESPLLVLIGSRLAPDVALPAGSREGWQAELPRERFREVPFGELVRFSVEEIEAALGALSRTIEGDPGDVAEEMHRITRGVPLAVRALLDLHEEGTGASPLGDLAEDDEAPLDEAESVREVVGKVARRMLYHLAQDRKPEREDDLRDIIALAILQRSDGDILKQLWPGRRVRDRLRDLGTRYALLSGGDLHATVRDYLRRFWRDETERPGVFDEVLHDIERAIEAPPPPSGEEGCPEAIARRTLQLNLQTWREGDRAVPDLARLLAMVMAYDEGMEDVQALLKELPLEGRNLSDARKLWKNPKEAGPDQKRVVAWLRGIRKGSQTWSASEQACLALIDGVLSAGWRMKPAEAIPVLVNLNVAFDHFGPEHMPQRAQVGEAFFDIASAFHPHWSEEKEWLLEMEQAYLRAYQLGIREGTCLNNLGTLYQDYLQRYEESERAYLRAIELDPKSGSGHRGLAWLSLCHKGDLERARQFAQEAMERDPTHPGSRFAMIAVTTWTTGWAAAQTEMREWLTKCPHLFVPFNRARLVALFRKVREQDGLPILAEMLRSAEDRACWKPWLEAISAWVSGEWPGGCHSAEGESLYRELSQS